MKFRVRDQKQVKRQSVRTSEVQNRGKLKGKCGAVEMT